MESFQEAVHVVRGGIVESVHAAAVVVCDAEGKLAAWLGDPELPVVLRSVAKPFQASVVAAAGVVRSYGITPAELALISGSHAGDPVHQQTAASILEKIGLDAGALRCGTHVPFSKPVAQRLAREGAEATVLMNNCSGKHAGMLAAAKAGGHDLKSYLEKDHPIQRANLDAVAAFTGRDRARITAAVDGCSAPTFSVTLKETARAYARLASGRAGGGIPSPLHEASREVTAALRAHPVMIAGEGMLDTLLMQAVQGLIAKVGADGMHAMAWSGPDGPRGVAIKVMDGHIGRPRTAVVLEVLRQIGAVPRGESPEGLSGAHEVRNHRGLLVGEYRPVFSLSRPA